MRIVMKFGGTSIADGNNIRYVAQLLKDYYNSGYEVVAVTSALGSVTDGLLSNAIEVSKKGKVSQIKEFISDLTHKHYSAVHEAIDDEEIIDETIQTIDCRVDELEKALIGICYLGELTPRSIDYISSYGERLAAPIVSGAIRSIGIKSKMYTGGDVGIVTDNEYGSAKPLEQSYQRVGETLRTDLSECIPVVTGFIAENKDGVITTLGRGGSDFSASIIGASIDADEIWLWKEVHGIMTTDPKIVPEARSMSWISYAEAMELSYFGARVLHPRAIEPAIRNGIPVRVKNTFEPNFSGTLVVSEQKPTEDVVKAVTLIKKVSLVNISGAGMVGTIGTAARVFNSLADANVNIIMISQASSESNMSIVVDEDHLEAAVNAINSEFDKNVIKDVTYDNNICVVAVVGAGMAGIPGVSGRVFSSLGKDNINVVAISQGSSQHNISFVVSEEEAFDAVRVLHKEFELESKKREE
ncbi:aspartate kinase [Methanohalobium evestigatum Z-7303]|uniref:Aspartokinase n=1 Tax=Methanohalobium evestigatum (strain ATCC BAA-1072 / DSM 3721 / NBRC 107634 / OCM 161 / Z-7303) TaxID=644295 RepID=D7EBL4_METEZ|nr:aspartate kinase [Methanohalobium evestigatum]ADI74856.1 aspartate kinase [Methanohalobium evestigatum Z-7303]